jgi:DNA repair protein RecN (Recombination protein N)
MERAARYDNALESTAAELAELADRLQDAGREVMAAGDGWGYSQRELDDIQSRLDVLSKLSKRYGGTVADMIAYLDSCLEELDRMEYADDRLKILEKQRGSRYNEALALARTLSDTRRAAARELEARIGGELVYLDMPGAKFEIHFVNPDGDTPELTADGIDRAAFYISVNPGEEPKPLSRVASGGELSRIMLAIKNVLAEGDGVRTMVFDEIDNGISGRAAAKVARKLAEVSAGRQVLCVTHLAQIAAMADRQLLREIAESGGRTYTKITPLDMDGRAREVARITAGDRITEAAIGAAKELINEANEYKATVMRLSCRATRN